MENALGESLQSYLRRLWGTQDIRVISVCQFSRGSSRETWSIKLKGSLLPFGSKLILRRDLPSSIHSVVPQSLRYEYEIYRCLQGSKVPVPRVVIYEDDPEALPGGRPFYLRELKEGSWEVENYFNPDPEFDQLRIQVAQEHVRKLALLHMCDWQSLGFDDLMPVPEGVEDCAHAGIERNWRELKKFQFEALPIVTEAREWLHDNAPVAPRIALLKGTNGLGEEIFQGREIVAMCDWEQASLGDPASDFSRTQNFLTDIVRNGQTLWGVKQALDYYEEVSGIHIPLSSVEYYHVFNAYENVVALHHAAQAIVEQSHPSVRLSWLATEVLHYGQRILTAAFSQQVTNADALYSTHSKQ